MRPRRENQKNMRFKDRMVEEAFCVSVLLPVSISICLFTTAVAVVSKRCSST